MKKHTFYLFTLIKKHCMQSKGSNIRKMKYDKFYLKWNNW